MIDKIPPELFYFVGLFVLLKWDSIRDFFVSKIKHEVRVSLMEQKIDNLTVQLGKFEATLEKYQKDLNSYFEKMRKSA